MITELLTTKFYYRTAQVVSIVFLPLAFLSLFVLRVEDRIVVDGVVESDNYVTLRSPLDDTLIENILVEPGADVKSGQALLNLQDLKSWRNELEKKEKRLEYITEKADVYQKLRKEGAQSGLITKDSQNEANILEIEIRALKENVGRLTLRAPFAGKITEVMVKPYSHVEVGTPLAKLSAMDEKIIRCQIPESRFPFLRQDQTVAVKSNLYNYFKWKIYSGKVKSYYSYASHENEKPTYETKIVLTGEGRDLLTIGSTARCEILVEDRPLIELLLGEDKR